MLLAFLCLTQICTHICEARLTDAELAEKARQMEQYFREMMKQTKVPGMAFCVSRSNKVIHTQAFGYTTIPSNSPQKVDTKTLFPISSVTKNFTAILVGALVDAGKLVLDDKVRKYVPDFFVKDEELSNEFTILDLISQRSGYPHFSADSLLKAGYDKKRILDTFKYLKHNSRSFRKEYGYQNIIYGIVGQVIENATGERYEDLVQEYIYGPMGMENASAIRLSAESSKFGYFKYLLSRFSHDKKKLGFFKAVTNLIVLTFRHKSKKVTESHARSMEEIFMQPENGLYQRFVATSGVSLSAEDFAKWMEMLANKGTYMGKQIVSQKVFEKLTSQHVKIDNIKPEDITFVKERYSRSNFWYGAGMFSAEYNDNGKNGRRILFHMGGIYGVTAFFCVVPEEDIAAGVACNMGGVALTLCAEYLIHQFLDLCLGFSKIDWIKREVDRKENFLKKHERFKRQMICKNLTPMERPDKYVGKYTCEIYGDVEVTEEDGELYISNGLRKAKLRHENGGIFSFLSKDMVESYGDTDEYASFFQDSYGSINSLYLSCFDENSTKFKKVTD